jgi:hypothetical protein
VVASLPVRKSVRFCFGFMFGNRCVRDESCSTTEVPLYYINHTLRARKAQTKGLSKTNNVLIIGHARGCAASRLNYHGESFEVMGNVMPGARLRKITQTAKNDIRNLIRKDYLGRIKRY